MTYIILDIGGTKTRVASTNDLRKIDKISKFNTAPKFKAGMESIIKAIEDMKITDKIQGIAIGIRGRINEDKTALENDSVLSDWAKKPLAETLEKHFKTAVFIENDTALAGLGEAVHGAGQGADIVAYHTISTGIGGVKIENGVIDQSGFGFEPGHQILDIDRTILGIDITPTFENLVSGSGLEARMGVKPYDIPQSDLIWNELAEYLAHGLRNTILYWSPDAIILGGSMIIGDPKIEIEPIRKYTVEVLDGFVACPFITIATLGDDAGLYGAMVYLEQHLEK
ncbi:MAG: ROK family protein [Candidatus Pacebacteria bacterium]|nr:ROK family protein [Candidatus Paceibacterota bacterium]